MSFKESKVNNNLHLLDFLVCDTIYENGQIFRHSHIYKNKCINPVELKAIKKDVKKLQKEAKKFLFTFRIYLLKNKSTMYLLCFLIGIWLAFLATLTGKTHYLNANKTPIGFNSQHAVSYNLSNNYKNTLFATISSSRLNPATLAQINPSSVTFTTETFLGAKLKLKSNALNAKESKFSFENNFLGGNLKNTKLHNYKCNPSMIPRVIKLSTEGTSTNDPVIDDFLIKHQIRAINPDHKICQPPTDYVPDFIAQQGLIGAPVPASTSDWSKRHFIIFEKYTFNRLDFYESFRKLPNNVKIAQLRDVVLWQSIDYSRPVVPIDNALTLLRELIIRKSQKVITIQQYNQALNEIGVKMRNLTEKELPLLKNIKPWWKERLPYVYAHKLLTFNSNPVIFGLTYEYQYCHLLANKVLGLSIPENISTLVDVDHSLLTEFEKIVSPETATERGGAAALLGTAKRRYAI